MKETTKAVILARGLGTRMRAALDDEKLDERQRQIAERGLKTLVPISGDRCLLDFILESLWRAGFSDICLVIGDEHGAIREYCRKKNYAVSFAIQKQPRGTANAVLAAEEFAAGAHFLVVNSDNLYPLGALRYLKDLGRAGLIGFESDALVAKSNIPAERIAKFATVSTDVDGFLTEIVEKPEIVAADALVSMNAWIFSPRIFEACRQIEISPRGEFELTAAVMFAVRRYGEKFAVIRSDEGVLDLSSRADIASVATKLAEF
jgi:glucose-1-phosphate thymidylyltransferase